jgi:amino acid adenylation domain-containing protein
VAALRVQLAAGLAEHMIPAAFVCLEQFPITPNGKLDRAALPPPERASLLSREFEAPCGEVEVAIAAIWQALLGLSQVGRHDHFFEVGGHSLLAVRLVARIRHEMGVEIALQDLFAQATVTGLAQVVRNAKQSALPAIVSVERSATLPLSWAQQRLWFLDQLNAAASAAYAMPAGLRLSGPLDSAALHAALARIVARHEALRTRFASYRGEPVQIIAPADAGFTLRRCDLGAMPGQAQASALRALCADEFGAPFDLANGPLIRGQLIRLTDDEHVLLITQHHIISDGWSIDILVHELSTLYRAFSQGQADPLPPLPVQYADYAVWQRNCLHADVLERRIDFWKDALSGAPALLELPTDHPRPAQQSYAGSKFLFALPPALAGSLRLLGQRHGTTMFMTVLAGWSMLMMRLSGQQDVVIGTPIANRPLSEMETLMGLFVNTIAVRVRTDDERTVAQFLAHLKRTAVDAYAHQDLPFEKVVEAINPPRSMAYSPIFQVMLSMNNALSPEVSLEGLQVEHLELEHCTTQCDLSLSFADTGEGIECALEYATDLFDVATIARTSRQFQVLLEGMVGDDQQPVSQLPLLCEQERRQILTTFNATQTALPPEQLIHRLFESHAAARPDAIALVFEGRQLSYGELNSRANQVAHYLIGRGIGPDDRVAICMQRSVEMVVGMLGILKAGAAYVPLDPAYPAQRLAYMLDDSAPAALLTQSAFAHCWPDLDCPMAALDDAASPIWLQSGADPEQLRCPLAPHHLAYVIYTSGSTGMPKGVMNEHGAVANRLHWMQQTFPLTSDDCVLQKTPFGFDVSVWEFFWPLQVGARMVLAKPEGHKEPDYLAQLIDDANVTTLHFVPSMLQAFVDQNSAWRNTSVTRLFCSGEALSASLCQRVLDQWPEIALHNLYGPTEAAIDVTWFHCTKESVSHRVPIGRPIANTQIYVLDARLQPVPIGVAGEVHIGGVGVARGYLKRPELTAERFIDDPFSTEPGARLYKTGDLGRWLADGNLEYLGRNDFQVKIRGFRIELGEIESALAACNGVREAVVIAREDTPGDKRLVAYLLTAAGSTPDVAALRVQLAAGLAEHMIPAAFVCLEQFPITPNGKLDRAALPPPERASLLSREFEAPCGEVEVAIAAIWQALLGLSQVGRHDHFFELGGHSLLAVRLSTALHREFEVQVPLSRLFMHPTIATLAEYLAAGERTVQKAIPVLPDAQDYALSPTQLRMWLFQKMNPASTTYHVSGMLDLPRGIGGPGMARILDTIVERQSALRTVFIATTDGPRQVILPRMPVRVEVVDIDAAATTIAQVYAAHTIRPFDLETGPLFHACVAASADGDKLLWSMHHIIADGLSIDILQAEMDKLIVASHSRQSPALPLLPIRYVDYAAWQNESLLEDAQQSKAFWHRQLAGELPTLDLPYDYPVSEQVHATGAAYQCLLPAHTSERLLERGRQHGVSQFNVLLSSFLVLLARMTGQNDLIVGTPVAGRAHPDVEHVIGCFINSIMLRNQVDLGESFARLLQRVAENTLQALTHQNYPFEQLADEIKAPQYANRSQVSSVFLNQLSTETADSRALVDGMGHRILTQGTKFDLNIYIRSSTRGLVFDCHYRTACFKAATIEYIFTQFVGLLEQLAQEFDRPCADLAIFGRDSNRLVLPEKIARVPFVPFDDAEIAQSIPQRFAAQARQRPGQIAIRSQTCQMTYGELDSVTNVIARAIVSQCGTANECVAILFEHDAPMLLGLLGALKANKAYVPLDPSYPEARSRFMFENSRATLLLTNQRNLAFARTLANGLIPILNVDDIHAGTSDAAPDFAADPDHLAYILYTSGSTGQPKGVMQSHRNALYFCKSYTNNLHIRAQDCVLLLASYCFDAAVMDIFGALMNGATLSIIDPRSTLREDILRRIEHERVTIYHSTPTLYRHLFGELDAGAPDSIRLVVLGGELVSRNDILTFQTTFSENCVFVNGYGPTESTLALQNFITKTSEVPAQGIPAGHAIDGTDILLDDPGARPRVYQKGEIIIRSEHVALGYWDLPEVTGRAFGTDAGGARYYRTGDIGYYGPDGSVTIRGRSDHQVKIRGFRIELGEIEHALCAIAWVREAVVIARADPAGESALIAYVVLHDSSGAPADAISGPMAIRRALESRLPGYMLPSAVVLLEAIPLTPSGKIDRLALPAPTLMPREATCAAPQTKTEEELLGLWTTLFKSENIGVRDDFFAIGGHSLLAAQLISRVRLAFGLELPLLAIFEAPTIETLAQKIDACASHAAKLAIPPILPIARNGPTPASFSQEQLWFLHQFDASAGVAYHMATGLRLIGTLNKAALKNALDCIVARHESLRTTFDVTEDGVFQCVGPAQAFVLHERDFAELGPQEKRAALAQADAEEAREPFDLATGPLIRGQLIRLGEEEHALFVTMHHIISDGWSMGLLVRELRSLYTSYCHGHAPALAPLAVQYADYAAWQRNFLQGEQLQTQLDFWKAQLAGAPRCMTFPTDRPRGEMQSYAGGRVDFALTAELSAGIRALARRHGATVFMTLLAAWSALLTRLSGQTDIVIGTPVANRQHKELESLIGFFVNTVALRMRLEPELSLEQVLSHVKNTTLNAYAHQDLPFNQVVQAVNPVRDVSHSPIFQVMMAMTNTPSDDELTLPGLVLTDIEKPQETTYYDLSLSMRDTGEQLVGRLVYASSLFDAASMEGLIEKFSGMLVGFMLNDQQRLDERSYEDLACSGKLALDEDRADGGNDSLVVDAQL